MEVSFNGAEGATVELMRRWLNAIDQSDGLGLVPLRTYGILCKSKDDTLFPLLCCNAGALPEGMEIRDERGHFARNAAYVSPVLSRNGESYRCERVVELPDDVKRSLKNVCLFFHAKESVEKPDVTEPFRDFQEKLEALDEYCPYDMDIRAIRWVGTDLIGDLATLADAGAVRVPANGNRQRSLWAIMENALAFHKKITDRSGSLPTDATDIMPSTREIRVDALEALKKVFGKLSARSIVDMFSFQTALSNLYASYGWNKTVARFHAQATPIIKVLETEQKFLSVSQLLRILNAQVSQAIQETESEEAGSRDYDSVVWRWVSPPVPMPRP